MSSEAELTKKFGHPLLSSFICISKVDMAASSSTNQQGLPRKPLEPTGMLHRVLSGEDYALALTPGFFGFYGHIGVLKALEETNCLRPSHVSGSSAGALVGGFLSAGKYLVNR